MTNKQKMFNPQIEAEKLLLSTIIVRPKELSKIPSCTPEHFTVEAYRHIFKVIKKLSLSNKDFDLISISQELINQNKMDQLEILTTELMDNSTLTFSIEKIFSTLQTNFIKNKSKEITEKLLLDIEFSDQNIQTLLTEFHYKAKLLNGSNDIFTPYELTLDYIPTEAAEVATFCGETILRSGNILTVISGEGFGKSRLMSTIVSSRYSDCDTFNFNLHIEENGLILHIDTEQERNEVHKGMQRILKRSKSEKIINDNKIRNYILQSFVTIPTIDKKREWLFNLIEKHEQKISLLILDGLTDFVSDVNNLQESQDFLSRLTSYMNSYNFAIIATIHKNSNDDNGKARGHIGSELLRKSGSVLQLAKTQNTHQFFDDLEPEQVRTLTNDFRHGKNRFGSDRLSSYFAWNDKLKMFSSCELEEVAQKTVTYSQKMETAIYTTFDSLGVDMAGYSDLLTKYVEIAGKAESTAKRHIKDALKKEILIKSKNGLYSIKDKVPF